MTWPKKRALEEVSWRRIFGKVLLVHLALVAGIWLAYRQVGPLVAKKPLAVRVVEPVMTVTSPSPPSPRKASPSPAAVQRPSIAKTAPAKEKKKTELPPPKAKKDVAATKPLEDTQKNELISQLDKGLAALAAPKVAASKQEATKPPAQGHSVPNVAKELNPSLSAGYEEELVTRLRLLLRLPEYGAVRVAMTLNRKGQVQKIAVLAAESLKNQEYIEKTLPGIVFPGFLAHFEGEEQHEFVLSLSNEM